jgi:hypothetical protein
MISQRYFRLGISFAFLLILLCLQASSNALAFDIDYGGRIPTPVRTRKPTTVPTATPTVTPTPTPTTTIVILEETTPVPTRVPPGGSGNAGIIGFSAGLFGGLLLFIPVVSFWLLKQRNNTFR